jgi:putative amino acid transporter
MVISTSEIWKYMSIPAIAMLVGLCIAIFLSYKNQREYNVNIQEEIYDEEVHSTKFTMKHLGALLGAVSAFLIQLIAIAFNSDYGALTLGAIVGLVVMVVFGSISIKEFDKSIYGGISMMGFIAFVMMVASGYGDVLRASGGVEQLVETSSFILGGSKLFAAFVMLSLGLIITMGIGTSFGTIPIIATIYVPLCISLNFSIPATIILIGTAAALGDAGSPASDSTLGPTAGLNFDGQHDHIKDSCIPTFLHYNIPLFVAGLVASVIL